MEFNARPGDLMRISSLFSDDDCVSDAAAIAQKLREFNNKKLNLNKETQEGRDS
jgi:hypothetical protein